MIDRDLNKPLEVLSYEAMNNFIDIVIASVDLEFLRIIEEKERQIVFDFLNNLYYSSQHFTFYVPLSIEHNTNSIMESAHIRDFVMNVVERVNMTACFNTQQYQLLFNTIGMNVCFSKAENVKYCAMPKQIIESINVNIDTLILFLRNNFWYLIINLISIHLHKADLFKLDNTKRR